MKTTKFNIENLDLFYGENQALKSINLPILLVKSPR